jgi:KDO2-lipid IV(A) lauroyltransferase
MLSINAKAKIVQIVLKGFAKLPFGLAQRIGMVLGFLLYVIPNPVKKVVRTNIQRCFPTDSTQTQQRLICSSLMHVVASAAEYGAWWLWPPQKLAPLVNNVYGEEYIQAARAQGKGILILAPHLGAWEIAQGYMPSRYPCSIMYRPLRITALEEFVRVARERGGGDLLPLTPSGLREAYAKLARGELLAILPDQVPSKNGGVFAPFFGISAWTMTLAIKLAQKTQVEVFIGYGERLACGRGFDIHFEPVNPEIFNPDLTIAAAAMNADIEACVRKIPEQYQWAYKRFKVQPEGQKKFYP